MVKTKQEAKLKYDEACRERDKILADIYKYGATPTLNLVLRNADDVCMDWATVYTSFKE